MTKIPPLLPHETFVRVIRLAKLDGLSVSIVAGIFALLAAVAGDLAGAIVGLMVAGAGAVELHGVSLLQRSLPQGMNWLVGSQLFLLCSILTYCAVRLAHLEVPQLPDTAAQLIDVSAKQLDITREEYLRFIQRLVLQIFAGVSLLYQGGMAFYYYRRHEVVSQALTED